MNGTGNINLQRREGLCGVNRKAFRKFQSAFRVEKVAVMKQTTILDHFHKNYSKLYMFLNPCIPWIYA